MKLHFESELDYQKHAFDAVCDPEILTGANYAANQIEFVNLVVEHLTEHGTLDAGVLYESPITDISPRGPDGLFSPEELQALVWILSEIQTSAIAL